MTRWLIGFVLVLAVALPATGWAWKGSLGTPTPIQEVHEKAESGDYVIVEGVIVDVRSGGGSYRLATLEDDTGRVIVAVPEYLRRTIEKKPGESARHSKAARRFWWARSKKSPTRKKYKKRPASTAGTAARKKRKKKRVLLLAVLGSAVVVGLLLGNDGTDDKQCEVSPSTAE